MYQNNITSVPINADNLSTNLILVVEQNISSRKKLENALKRKLEMGEKLNAKKSRFVMMASHEFRTPLATILSSTFLLENYAGSQHQPEMKEHFDNVADKVIEFRKKYFEEGSNPKESSTE